MTKRPVWLSWSSGKDSAWALHTLRRQPGIEVTALFSTINVRHDRVAMHAVRRQLLEQQAAAVGLPLQLIQIPDPCDDDTYARCMTLFTRQARAAGVDHFAFGDLFLEDVRRYREQRLADCGISALFPLWGSDTAQLADTMIDAGIRARLTCIDPRALPAGLVGRSFDRQLLAALPTGTDPCGEYGEFHSFVHDGPMFDQPVPVRAGAVVQRDGFVFADLLPG